jgi:hypothetical protein
MRRAALLLVLATVLAACTAGSATSSATSATSATVPPPTTPSLASSGTSVSPVPALPPGVPASFADDVPSAQVPVSALIPPGTDPTGTWYGRTSAGEAIVVAWEVPGSNPLRVDRGIVVWRRFGDDGPPWRPVFGTGYAAAATPVLGLDATIRDVTGDGSDDALLFAGTGGSGGCGIYAVVDLAAGTQIYRRSLCDAQVVASTSRLGLTITQAVYAVGDAHCCPSSFKETLITYGADGTWHTVWTRVRPA